MDFIIVMLICVMVIVVFELSLSYWLKYKRDEILADIDESAKLAGIEKYGEYIGARRMLANSLESGNINFTITWLNEIETIIKINENREEK